MTRIHEGGRGDSSRRRTTTQIYNLSLPTASSEMTVSPHTQEAAEASPKSSLRQPLQSATEQPKETVHSNHGVHKDCDTPFDTAKYRFKKGKPAPWRAARLQAENTILKSALRTSRLPKRMTRITSAQAGKENAQPQKIGTSLNGGERSRGKVRFVMPYRCSSTSNSSSERVVPARVAKKKRNSVLTAQVAQSTEASKATESTVTAGPAETVEAVETTEAGTSASAEHTGLVQMGNRDEDTEEDGQPQQKGKGKMPEPARRRIVLTPVAKVDKQQQELKFNDLEERFSTTEAKTTELSLGMRDLSERISNIEQQLTDTKDDSDSDDDEHRNEGCLRRFLGSRAVCWIVWTVFGLLVISILMDYRDAALRLMEEEKFAIHWGQVNAMKPVVKKQRLNIYLDLGEI
ncbi:hypothetical protein TWF696_008630 [Orbilia brochopaga]|uniref:Uncharacterized protein n=1 Tax=Orbilia brochopaga TaxID=3140254 RepID=A0AAV9UGL1_9PEZI